MSKNENTERYSPGELMAAVIARDLRDGEVGAVGANGQVPSIACRLAQATHAPNLWWLCGPAGTINSKFDRLVLSTSDYRMHTGAEAQVTLDQVMDLQGNPRFMDFGCYGGFQIDQYGNINMAFIGDRKRPKFRGPGSVGLMATAWAKRVYLYSYEHSRRLFPEKVDFISGPGFLDGSQSRANLCPQNSNGPCLLVTPLAVFDFEEKSKRARIRSIHPGHSVEEVLDKTGFSPIVPKEVPEAIPPSKQELQTIRSLDPDRLLWKLVK